MALGLTMNRPEAVSWVELTDGFYRYYVIAKTDKPATFDIMLLIKSANEVATELAQRIRARRLQRGWTQAELAARAGLRAPTYVLFERSGRISLLRLLKVLETLNLVEEFDRIGRHEDLTTLKMEDLAQPPRQRGRRRQT
jgi:DNA-binding XRE family transcriptional regulator